MTSISTAAIVLAAGASTRMGRPKALLELGGRTFMEAIAEAARAAGVDPVLFVLGPPDGERIRQRLPPGCRAAWNDDPGRGMLSSIQAGVAALQHQVDRVLIWPVDQPTVGAATVRQLLDAASQCEIAVPQYEGRGGHPVRIGRSLFPELLALPVAEGMRALLRAHPEAIARIPVEDPGVSLDVDTPEELDRLARR